MSGSVGGWGQQRPWSTRPWGEKGERLKELTSVDTMFSTKHNLALSRRDAGRVPEALESFLAGESLETVVKAGKRIQGKGAPFYGNIGRCLFLANRLDEALACYVKSAQLLEDSLAHNDHINKGYIRSWIAELLVQQEEFGLAAASYRAAECIWNGFLSSSSNSSEKEAGGLGDRAPEPLHVP